MKNMKIYNGVIALALISQGISLLSLAISETTLSNMDALSSDSITQPGLYLAPQRLDTEKATDTHKHYIGHIGDIEVIIRECDGMEWRGENIEVYETNHQDESANMENSLIEDGVKVLTFLPQNSK